MPLGAFYVFRQRACRMGDRSDIDAALLATPVEHPAAADGRESTMGGESRPDRPRATAQVKMNRSQIQRRRTENAKSVATAPDRRSAPTSAIIAPLSVQKLRSGKNACPPRLRRRQRAVRAVRDWRDRPRHHESRMLVVPQGGDHLGNQNLDHRVLELARDVGPGARRRARRPPRDTARRRRGL